MDIRVGNRIVAIKECDGLNDFIGRFGIVSSLSSPSNKLNVLVHFDDPDCDLPSKDWWCEESSLKVLWNNEFEIEE